jgi:hypothetical protein
MSVLLLNDGEVVDMRRGSRASGLLEEPHSGPGIVELTSQLEGRESLC